MFEPNVPLFTDDQMHLRRQRTIGQPVRTRGIGFFTAADVAMTLYPAPAGHGVTFERTDRRGEPIAATVDNLAALPRRTALADASGRPQVQMIEHTMAAISGLDLDNIRVCVEGAECPGFDGSSEELTGRLLDAGIVEQEQPQPVIEITHRLEVSDGHGRITIEPSPRGLLEIEYHLDYAHPQVGLQRYRVELTPRVFQFQLADARTFITEDEVGPLRQMGIGTRHSARDLIVFGEDGPIDNVLRHSDEPVRHKLLDCVGDFALAGCELRGRFVCHRSGHALNHEAVREVLASHAVVQSSRRIAVAA